MSQDLSRLPVIDSITEAKIRALKPGERTVYFTGPHLGWCPTNIKDLTQELYATNRASLVQKRLERREVVLSDYDYIIEMRR